MIYERIKTICSERKMSINKLEEEAGLSNGSINKWALCSPSVASLARVAKVLNVTVDELIREEKED